jgi:membrane-associated phospholipid phosphatase
VIERLASLDERGVARVRGLPHPRAADAALAGLSRATDHSAGWFAAGLAGAALDRRRRRRWLAATARIGAVELAVRAVKRAHSRRRPDLPALAPVTSPNSFPSAHTAAATVAVSAFGGLLPRPLLGVLLALTAFSRLYLGVHYPSDVLAGVLIGRACAGLTRPGSE